MTEWFGLSRQSIYNAIDKRSQKRREIWTGKRLTESERDILLKLISARNSGEADGDIVYCIKKPYFMPKYPEKFRINAQLRGLSADEYAIYLSGYPIGDTRAVNDNQIVAFFQENLIDGKVLYI